MLRVLRLLGLSVAIATGMSVIYYYGSSDVSPAMAIVVGIIAGLVIIPVEVRFTKDPDRAIDRTLTRFPYFEMFLGTAGVVLMVLGAISGSLTIVVSGVPFIVVAAIFLLVKYRLRRLRS